MSRAATIHLEVDEEQLRELDRYREKNKVATRTALLDEALGEFFARRRLKYPRTYGKTTGLK